MAAIGSRAEELKVSTTSPLYSGMTCRSTRTGEVCCLTCGHVPSFMRLSAAEHASRVARHATATYALQSRSRRSRLPVPRVVNRDRGRFLNTQKPATAFMPCTTRSAVKTSWPMPMRSAAPTRAPIPAEPEQRQQSRSKHFQLMRYLASLGALHVQRSRLGNVR
jgi:hypothetical protein